MTDNDLYQQILGLTSPWRVSDVELRIECEEILIQVVHDVTLGQAQCPECRKGCPGYDTSRERRWRHLDTCQLKTYLVCSVPRVNCAEHGVPVAHVPWSNPGSGFTALFESLAIAVLRATTTQSRASHILRLSPGQVHDVMYRGVARGLSRRNDQEIINNLGIDEKAIHKGHSYATILSDTDGRRVLDVGENRTLVAAESLLERGLSPAQKCQVLTVSMDMWPAFQSAQENILPASDRVHDRFHIMGYLSDAVDRTRRSEHARLTKLGDTTLNKTKYVWLKNPDNMSSQQSERLESLANSELETAKVWGFKDVFKDFFDCETVEQGKAFFQKWLTSAIELRNQHLTKVANMLSEHIDGLLNYIKHRTTNATAEGINSQIQHIKASARGYRKFQSFRIAILFHLGKLDMNPH